ncbi:carbohydrate-binding domain-containing protein [Flavobacterium fluviatile]|uniref:carbohydrate-binding domain-containing protein n=1 Tax=Flavobacterium fluviatile TaxID=1862387 RepID=UPI0013D4DCDB|nr:carbohydrate-binding domain-containing protein [Flavobacterium fluviatile]
MKTKILFLNSVYHRTFSFSIKAVIITLLFIANPAMAQTYPFTLPNTITASLNVDTTTKEEFRNTLLGYNIEGFSTSLQKDFIRLVDPITIRFPHGVWSNFYQWQTDGYQNDSYDNKDHEATLAIYVDRIKGNIGGIASLNKERTDAGKKGFDMMWTYSINFDDGPSCVARALKDINLGLEVKAIELGNEHFWSNQRALRTATEADYLREASAVSVALKAQFPDIKLSIPLGWRRNQGTYNSKIIGNGNYFDAVTIHKYLGADPDVPGESNTAYQSLLTAKLELDSDVKWVRNNYAPGKPIWLTEWGVSAGSDVHGAACLGMADAYLYMADNQDIFERSNWFSFNRVLNSMVVVGSNREPVYPLQKRGYLSVYEIIRGVFKDATLLKGTITSSETLSTSLGTVNVVNGRMVTKGGNTSAVVVNLGDKPVQFTLNIDNKAYTNTFKHEALTFDNVGYVTPIDFYANPLVLIKEGSGTITLPPLSISKISDIILNSDLKNIPGAIEAEEYKSGGQGVGFSDTDTMDTLGSGNGKDGVDVGTFNGSKYVGDTQNGEWLKYGVNVIKTAEYNFNFLYSAVSSGSLVSVDIDGVNLFNNFSLAQTSGVNDFKTISKIKVLLSAGQHELKVLVQGGGFSLDKISVDYYGLTPFKTIVNVPGTIQVEDYALGGQGVAYNDTTLGNDTSGYRDEKDVDLAIGGTGYVSTSLAGGEYTRYPIYVTESGSYHLEINYKTSSTTSKPIAAAILSPDLSSATQLFTDAVGSTTSGIIKKVDGNGTVVYGTYISNNFNLYAGNSVLELQIPSGGAGPNYDYMTLVRDGVLGVNSFNKGTNDIVVFPVPSKDGLFNLSKSTPWKVYTTLGSEILSGEGNVVNLSLFAKGVYLLKTKGEPIKKIIYQ